MQETATINTKYINALAALKKIQSIAKHNQTASVDIAVCTLSHIQDICEDTLQPKQTPDF